ncbi:MAG: hypothetical protein EXR67_06685 [Dehalococcoidia bacterium]|nr:hypothetical protein [Dehalococcoidia bacterium]
MELAKREAILKRVEELRPVASGDLLWALDAITKLSDEVNELAGGAVTAYQDAAEARIETLESLMRAHEAVTHDERINII